MYIWKYYHKLSIKISFKRSSNHYSSTFAMKMKQFTICCYNELFFVDYSINAVSTQLNYYIVQTSGYLLPSNYLISRSVFKYSMIVTWNVLWKTFPKFFNMAIFLQIQLIYHQTIYVTYVHWKNTNAEHINDSYLNRNAPHALKILKWS